MATGETAPDVTIELAGAERIDDLRDLWLALHRNHRQIGALPVIANDADSWLRRRATYLEWLTAGEALLFVATVAEGPVGYAMVHLQRGPDDTWPLGDRYAELYSLSVAPNFRGRGIGSKLLDRVDGELERLGIRDLQVAVMAGNWQAQRFYEHRGLRAGGWSSTDSASNRRGSSAALDRHWLPRLRWGILIPNDHVPFPLRTNRAESPPVPLALP